MSDKNILSDAERLRIVRALMNKSSNYRAIQCYHPFITTTHVYVTLGSTDELLNLFEINEKGKFHRLKDGTTPQQVDKFLIEQYGEYVVNRHAYYQQTLKKHLDDEE